MIKVLPQPSTRRVWWRFWDKHSGGGTKRTPFEQIYLEAATEDEACNVFEQCLGRDPRDASCECCGNDYAIDSAPTLEQASAYHRNCDYNSAERLWVEKPLRKSLPLLSLDEYCVRGDVLVIQRSL